MKAALSQPEPEELLRNPGIVMDRKTVSILDCGGQYTELVLKACERQGYHAVIYPHDTPAEQLADAGALIIAGSPGNAHEVDAPMPDPNIWELPMAKLGICFGMHAMAIRFGGKLERGQRRQDGRVATNVNTDHPLFKMTKPKTTGLFTHGNFVTKVPEGFEVIGSHTIELANEAGQPVEQTVVSAIARGNVVGVQFHPEVFDDTPDGYAIFKAFLLDVAGLEPDQGFLERRTEDLIDSLRGSIKERVGNRDVVAFVSGGVDSSVALALALGAIDPTKIHARYIDNGFMRDEDEAVIELLQHLGADIRKIDAVEQFENARVRLPDGSFSPPLMAVSDPELKRQIIGDTFIDVCEQIEAELGLEDAVLLQGTNAADKVESGRGKGTSTAVIKTHHNQTKRALDKDPCEPLSDLFKDEIRNIGRVLGLPPEIVDRQPFPGPGTAIRILCADGSEFDKQPTAVREAISTWVAARATANNETVRSCLLPVRNVGVGGDERSHLAVLGLDAAAPWEAIQVLSSEATAIFKGDINRVVVRLDGKMDNTPTVTPTKLSRETRLQLRQADRIVFEEMRRHSVIGDISQCPVVLLPISFDGAGKRSIVLRPIKTLTFMTSQAMLPSIDLPEAFTNQCAARILDEVPGISTVFLDCTNKPPATTEWE